MRSTYFFRSLSNGAPNLPFFFFSILVNQNISLPPFSITMLLPFSFSKVVNADVLTFLLAVPTRKCPSLFLLPLCPEEGSS